MARKRKAMPTVKLERQPHRDARERLRQAYQLLIEAHQSAQSTDVKLPPDERTTNLPSR